MDKIKQLLSKCGLSDETAAQICESLDSYTVQMKQQLDEEFKIRLAKAKKICMEETGAHKAELTRRLQVFLEAKNVAIEEQITRHVANREAEAVAKLEKISSLVEGIELNGQSCSELQAEISKLKRATEHLVEERVVAVKKANRLSGICERVLNRNRELEKSISESSTAKPQAKPKKLDESRSRGKRKTTQRTMTENVDPKPAARPNRKPRAGSPDSPEGIAASMDEDV